MKKVMLFVDLISVTGLLIYNFKMVQGNLRFGRKMGDLAYFSALELGSIIAFVLVVLKYLGIIKKGFIHTAVFALGLSLLIFYYSSFGRGPDYLWDRTFFG